MQKQLQYFYKKKTRSKLYIVNQKIFWQDRLQLYYCKDPWQGRIKVLRKSA